MPASPASTRPAARPAARPAPAVPALPISRYRGIAVALLLGLLGITALAPLSGTPPPATVLLPAAFDGRPAADPAAALFDYPAESQRVPAQLPPHAAVLHEPGITSGYLYAIAADMMVEDSGPSERDAGPSPAHPIRDSALGGGPSRWNNMAEFFDVAQNDWGANGLGVIESLRGAVTTGLERESHQRRAQYLLVLASDIQPVTGPYFYNWGMLQLMLGHYAQAAAAFDAYNRPATSHPEARFYQGVALLRLGESQAALDTWQSLAGEAGEWQAAAQEGLADARAALGDGGAAVAGYQALLANPSGVDWGVYEKLLRLQLAQGNPEQALDTMRGLAARFPDESRLLYDQGRLLLFLGRPGPARTALDAAVKLRPDDPALHAGLATALVAGGDARRALIESDAALRGLGLDPASPDLNLTYSKLENADAYQRSVGQAALTAYLARARALALQGDGGQVRTLAGAVEAQGSGDAAKVPWFRYYAGLLYAAGGLRDEALARFKPEAPGTGSPVGPGRGALLLAWVHTLSPAEAHAQLASLLDAAGGQNGTPGVPADAATATAYHDLAALLNAGGFGAEAGPLYRAAAAWEVGQQANGQQPPQAPDGTPRGVSFRAAEAEYLRRQGANPQLAAARYGQVLAVAPSLTGAYTNRALIYAVGGDAAASRRELEQAVRGDPTNGRATHNLGVVELRGGPGSLPAALGHLATARQVSGPAAIGWGNDPVPAPAPGNLPAPEPSRGLSSRVAALAGLLLLLVHTVIPRRRGAEAAAESEPAGSLLARLGTELPAWTRAPWLLALAVAAIAWAWALSGTEPGIWLALLPLTVLAALLAIGAQEVGHRLVLRLEREPGVVTTRLWAPGLILSLLAAPFGLPYGWLVTTHAGRAASVDDATTPVALDDAAPASPRPARIATPTGKPAAVRTPAAPAGVAGVAGDPRPSWRGWAAIGPAARVALGGLGANVVLVILFGALYGWLGHPVWRILLLANLAVLAFTAVSDRGADGWVLWRRSPLLWLLLFSLAAAALTGILLGAF
ncbi:MAG TPA: tetratricopeptide repeat protein [Chloroflexia bacterium]|nr:tetratricopeptide repeat protein [Chloroflexia bacterium]